VSPNQRLILVCGALAALLAWINLRQTQSEAQALRALENGADIRRPRAAAALPALLGALMVAGACLFDGPHAPRNGVPIDDSGSLAAMALAIQALAWFACQGVLRLGAHHLGHGFRARRRLAYVQVARVVERAHARGWEIELQLREGGRKALGSPWPLRDHLLDALGQRTGAPVQACTCRRQGRSQRPCPCFPAPAAKP
jgi:hypothetical protein